MDFFEDETAKSIEAEIDRILNDGATVTVDAELVTKAGEKLPYEFTGVPTEDDGDIIGVVGIGRRRAE